jgi:DNA polymerase elongation subunit (family B)
MACHRQHGKLTTRASTQLMDSLDTALRFAIEQEGGYRFETVTNYDEVRASIVDKLAGIRDTPNRLEAPLIYHLDVAAMYPNIILTNRMQVRMAHKACRRRLGSSDTSWVSASMCWWW